MAKINTVRRPSRKVDRRVNQVRALWNTRYAVTVLPAASRSAIRLLLMQEMRIRLGGSFGMGLTERKYLYALATPGMLNIRTIRTSLDDYHWAWYVQRVAAANAGVLPKLSSTARRLIALVNGYRMMLGIHPLKASALLTKAAENHRKYMSQSGKYAHDLVDHPYGDRPADRVRFVGLSATGVGENIAKGQANARGVHRAWYRSSGHHRGMLSPLMDHMGAAGKPAREWVELFALLGKG